MNTDKKKTPLYERVFVLLLVVLLPVIILLLLIYYLLLTLKNLLFLVALWLIWLPQGKDTLVVYSNSPHWQEYFESIVLPLLNDRCKVLNWSERNTWSLLDWRTLAFHFFAGDQEFNPIVIVFKPLRWPRKFRFMQAMHDMKHQNFSAIHKVTTELSDCLKITVPAPEP